MTIYQRQLLNIPSESAIDVNIRKTFAWYDLILAGIPPVDPEKVMLAHSEMFSNLVHPLSLYAEARTFRPLERPKRSLEEAKALSSFLYEISGMRPGSFLNTVLTMHEILIPNGGHLRSSDVELSPDLKGVRVRFPDPHRVAAQLEMLSTSNYSCVTLKACVCMAVILNCHPFPDGNGRLSRCYFNFVLMSGGLNLRCYIPLFEIMQRSRKGFEIRLRALESQGDWSPLLMWAVDVLELCATF